MYSSTAFSRLTEFLRDQPLDPARRLETKSTGPQRKSVGQLSVRVDGGKASLADFSSWNSSLEYLRGLDCSSKVVYNKSLRSLYLFSQYDDLFFIKRNPSLVGRNLSDR